MTNEPPAGEGAPVDPHRPPTANTSGPVQPPGYPQAPAAPSYDRATSFDRENPYQAPTGQPHPYQDHGQYGGPTAQYGAYPDQQNPYSTPGQPGPYPAAPGQPGPYPAPGQSGGYPAPGQSGGYPAPGQSEPYPAPGQSEPYPAPGQSGGYPAPAGASDPYAGPGRSGTYQGAPGPQGEAGQPTGYPPLMTPPPGYGVPQWGQPQPPPRPAGPPSRNGFAVAALVFGILGGLALGLVFGIIALVQIRRTGQRGKGMAITGIVLTLMWGGVIAALVVFALMSAPNRDTSGTVTKGGTILVNDVRIGDCLERWATAGNIAEVNVVPCTSAHQAEVFHTFTLPGTAFPGDRQVTAQATNKCLAAAKAKLTPADTQSADIAYLKPLRSSWDQGDHDVACVAVVPSGTISRSMRS